MVFLKVHLIKQLDFNWVTRLHILYWTTPPSGNWTTSRGAQLNGISYEILHLFSPASRNFNWYLTCLQAILDRAISNWYFNNVRALTIEMHALQLNQLPEQLLFLFDCVWCTLQSADTNFRTRFELQLNSRYVFLICRQTEFVWTTCLSGSSKWWVKWLDKVGTLSTKCRLHGQIFAVKMLFVNQTRATVANVQL